MKSVILTVLMLTGCATHSPVPPVATEPPMTNEITGRGGMIAVQVNGKFYRFVQAANGKTNELWSKDGEAEHWYFPTIDWTLHPDHEPSFNSLLR